MESKSDAEDDGNGEVNDLFVSVCDALSEHAGQAVFAVGGKIGETAGSAENTLAHGPIAIRWDSGNWNQGCKVTLPLKEDASSPTAFTQLLEDAEPATFGVGDKEVLDETYRKAGKIDESKFSTNFNPYEFGVVDTVLQALVRSSDARAGMRGLRAELYKLNVSSLFCVWLLAKALLM